MTVSAARREFSTAANVCLPNMDSRESSHSCFFDKRGDWAYSVEKLMVFRVLDHRVNGSRLDFIEWHWPELGSELVWLTF